MKTTLRVFSYLRRYPWMAVSTLACAVLTTLLVAVFPKVTQLVIDDVRAGRHGQLLTYSLVALAAFFLRDLFNALRIVLNNTFEQRVILRVEGHPELSAVRAVNKGIAVLRGSVPP